jgi:long-chain fatty acid transport protein
MSKKNTGKLVRSLVAVVVVAGPMSAAMATNGYFSHGYGMKAKGMGGAAVALTDTAFAGANNPAAAAWAGNRMELGVDLFMPTREMTRTGSGLNASVSSDSNLFLVPEFGYNRAISDKLGVGITVYGNGGMNTDYAGAQLPANSCGPGAPASNVLCGQGRLGVDLMQLIIAPTVAFKVSDKHSFGISPLLVKQIFKADGLQMFQGMSSAPGSVSGYGYDGSNGVGVRLGYLGKVNEQLTVGASYAPKIAMSKLTHYAGLFAEAGGFDIPENYTVGMSYQASPSVNVALDYQHIGYSGVASVANPSSNALIAPLGASNGAGFGWSDVNAWKLGVQWQASPALTLRAGFNAGDNPVKSRDVTFNILAPGVVTTHYTVGGTYAMSPTTEVTMSYMYAPSNSVSGSSLFNSLMGPGAGGTETVQMSQQALGFQFGWKW